MNTIPVFVDEKASTSAVLILIDGEGESTAVIMRGAGEQLTAERLSQVFETYSSHLSAIIVTFDVPAKTVMTAIQFAKDRGIPSVVDAGHSRNYTSEIWADCTVLTPNTAETMELVGYPITDDASIARAARQLLASGPQAVVVKRGSQGALLMTSSIELYIPALPVPVTDTTGAGDAFTATLAVAIADGLPLETAVQRANAAGAISCTRAGAMVSMPTRQEIDDLLGVVSAAI